MPEAVIVGAGIVGAACALHAARAGIDVTVLDRQSVSAGSTGAGEGNLLVSDKAPGPELALAQRSLQLWGELAAESHEYAEAGSLGNSFEFETKGGVVVARTAAALAALDRFAAAQRDHGVAVTRLEGDRLRELEPALADGLAGGAFYPGDAQVQPALAAAAMLRLAVAAGARLRLGDEAVALRRRGDGRLTGVVTGRGVIGADVVVNAAGTWAGAVAARFGAAVPVQPRRGFVLVTEPLPRVIRHKVYAADYVAAVASDDASAQISPVVEGTPAGPVLIGSSRERVGFDRTLSVPVVRRLAAQAVELFPVLAAVNVLRVYRGFRPYCPDHLPVIGADPRIPGLLHACGHEGAGIGLAPATGELIAALITGATPALDPAPFAAGRFLERAA